MISMFALKSSEGAEHYYTQDNYYSTDQGVEKSLWAGSGSTSLGLFGSVRPDEFKALLNGYVDDQQLGKREKNEEGSIEIKHRAGYDVTFSAPKSVSIMAEIYGDQALRDAHEKAVLTSLRYIEDNVIQVRQQVDGEANRVSTSSMVAALFQHETSRELDPQTHTHAVILNMSQGEDGNWRSINGAELLSQKRVIAAIYNAELAKEVQKLGYDISIKDDKGNFEIDGISRDQIEHFSQRRQQIAESLSDREIDISHASFDDRQQAALITREHKINTDLDALKKNWQQRATDIGLDGQAIQLMSTQQRTSKSTFDIEKQEITGKDAVRFSLAHFTEREAVVDQRDVVAYAIAHGVGRVRPDEVLHAYNQMHEAGEIVMVSARDRQITTQAVQSAEHWNVKQVLDGQAVEKPILDQQVAEAKLSQVEQAQRFKYSEGQRAAIAASLTSTDRFIGVQGLAGTGKTTMLKGLKDIAQEQGITVRGVAITGSASDTMARETGIRTETVAMFILKETKALKELSQAQQQNPSQKLERPPELWVVDESSLIGHKQMNRLVDLAGSANAKVIFLGDKLQLQAVSAGKPFEALQDRGMATTQMSEINRQKTDHMRDVVAAVVENSPLLNNNRAAFEKLDQHGGVISDSDIGHQVVEDYLKLDKSEKRNTVIITPFNRDRTEINSAIRVGLKAVGDIAERGEQHEILVKRGISQAESQDVRYYREGDVVRFGRDYKTLGLANGEYWRINSINQKSGKAMITNDAGRQIEWSPSETRRIEVYQSTHREVAVGDQLVFSRNSAAIKNGEKGEVVELKDGLAQVAISKNGATQIHELDLSQLGQAHWDHGYAQTVYSSQGLTKQNALLYLNLPKQQSELKPKQLESIGKIFGDRAFYVAATRATHDFKLYTNDKAATQALVGIVQDKTTTLDQARGFERDHER